MIITELDLCSLGVLLMGVLNAITPIAVKCGKSTANSSLNFKKIIHNFLGNSMALIVLRIIMGLGEVKNTFLSK